MSIHLQDSEDEHNELCEINTTPLIDVMLVLLIMLIITIPLQTHAVKLDLPNGPPPLAEPPPAISVQVEASGQVLWNGQAVEDGTALEGRLHDAAAIQPQPELHLQASDQAPYAAVAAVMAAAQRQNIRKLGLAPG